MKKLLAILFAALLIVGVAACGGSNNDTAADNSDPADDAADVAPEEGNTEDNAGAVDADATGTITYDDLDGYEKAEMAGTATFMAQDDETSFRMVMFLPVDDATAATEMREALDSQDFSQLETAYASAMENTEVSATTVGQADVIYLSGSTTEQGIEAQSVTALVIMGQQVAMVQGVSDIDNGNQLKSDVDTFISSFKLVADDSAADEADVEVDGEEVPDEAPVDADAEDEAEAA